MARKPIHIVARTSDWNVLMSPVRFELLEVMRSIAPCSVREMALALDRPADTLYPHLRKLLKVGVLVAAGERPGRTRPEQVYDLVADDLRPGFGGTSRRATGAAIDRSLQTMASIVSRASRKAADTALFAYGPEFRNVIGKLENAWLDAEELAQVRERLLSLKRYLDARKGRRAGALYLAAFFVVPVVRSRGAKRRTVQSSTPPGKRRARAR
jgi:predicted ArsR family transcriptional regulator